jgi:hypothetical protein
MFSGEYFQSKEIKKQISETLLIKSRTRLVSKNISCQYGIVKKVSKNPSSTLASNKHKFTLSGNFALIL